MVIINELPQSYRDYLNRIKIEEFDAYRVDLDIRVVLTPEFILLVKDDMLISMQSVNLETRVIPQDFMPYMELARSTEKHMPKGPVPDNYEEGDIVVTVAGLHKGKAPISLSGTNDVCQLMRHFQQYLVKQKDGLAHYVSVPTNVAFQPADDYITL